jgi:DNA helicase HerA-like ATPase
MVNSVRFPNDANRHAIIGATGSGKTQFGMWALSRRSYDVMPWVIFDYKKEELIAAIDPIELEPKELPPKKPGLYVVRPIPKTSDDEIENALWRIHQRGECGLYIDEGYMLPNVSAFRAILTQGRSLRIPCITLTQRPVFISRYVFSESEFFTLFRLTDRTDRKRASEFVPVNLNYTLPKYSSYFFDVGENRLTQFSPVPGADEIVERFSARMPQRKRTL